MKTPPIFLSDLPWTKEQKRFSGKTKEHLAGRCLIDALEFLRIDPKWPERFGQLLNAHAIRLCWQYVNVLGHEEMKARLRPLIESAYVHILDKRNTSVPFFGDDFWDWAYILEAQLTVIDDFSNAERQKSLNSDLATFYQEVKSGMKSGLTLKKSDEWFGPAVPTATYRVLTAARGRIGDNQFDACLKQLRKLALTPIRRGNYLDRPVRPNYYEWHMGQVAAQFPDKAKSRKKEFINVKAILKLPEAVDQVYALARVIQGAAAINDEKTIQSALERLYACETSARPLGTGIVADRVKASVNTLEAIWPRLGPADRSEVSSMLDAYLVALKRANRVGVLVAVDIERTACMERFKVDGATVDVKEDVIDVEHRNYRVAIVMGKALVGATDATARLINEHHVTTAILVGIAGSLGVDVNGRFTGPGIGDVVIGTSAAAYRIREKVRKTMADAPVPLNDSTWSVVPTDPTLFALAHRIGLELSEQHVMTVHEGVVVTGNGIKDNPQEKSDVRAKWPGGLAVAEEGFALSLGCLQHGIPQLELRGISDLAQGDKEVQGRDLVKEHQQQELAARNAAMVAVRLVNALSQLW